MNDTAASTRSQPLSGSAVWVDRIVGDSDSLVDLLSEYDLSPAAIEDVLDVEQLPKFEAGSRHLFVVLHSLSHDGDRVDTAEVDCFVDTDVFLTLRREHVLGLEWLWSEVGGNPHLAVGGPAEVFGHLCEAIGRRYLAVADELERRVDSLGEEALAAAPHVLGEVQLLRREEATVRTVLTPQLRLLDKLSRLSSEQLNDRAHRQLIDAYDAHSQVAASLAMSRQLLSDTLDTYRGAVAEGQGRAANLLTVYAAIVLPMTLIAGWYGMNTADLPAATEPWGWMVVTAVMAAVGIVSWLYFARLGLVGRPRLVEPIGKGLAVAARAPMRPVTMLRRDGQRRDERRPAAPTEDQ